MMSPRTKAVLNAEIPRPVMLVITILPLVAALSAFARLVRVAADERYVLADAFTLQHRTDSLVQDARSQRAETLLQALVRDCQRRGGCQ